MRVLIVDDEPLAREELRYLLSIFSQIEIVGEAGNIDEAKTLIQKSLPDCIFLDINMPEGDGFELLEKILFLPHVIFTTAYTDFAIKAFDVGATDYLVKPIDPRRLEDSVVRVQSKLEKEIDFENKLNLEENIFIRDKDQCWFVPVKEILICESIGNYSRIYFNNHKPMIKRSLSYLESRLPESHFFRVNRNFIVNMDSIEEIEVLENGSLEVEVGNFPPIEMSRRQAQRFKRLRGL